MDINVAIVDDSSDIREALKDILEQSDGFSCRSTFANGKDVIDAFKNDSLDVDVLIMDLDMPEIHGTDCIKALKLLGCEIPIMVLTVFDHNESIFEALKAGALGYILKSAAPSKMLVAIEDLHNGGSPMSAEIARKVVEVFAQTSQESYTIERKIATLSPDISKREQDILRELVAHKRYQEIADILFISVETVRTHARNIYRKLHLKNRKELINSITRSQI